MSAFVSTEMRWILEGAVPDGIWQWFSSHSLLSGPDNRADYYMFLKDLRTVGIKWREGKLEFKPLLRDCGKVSLAGGVTGRLEIWEKWSSKGLAAESIRNVPGMIVVEKSRVARKFEYTESSVSEVDAKKDQPQDGCNVELTRLRVRNREFWTFGFEAFADPMKSAQILILTAEKALGAKDIPVGFLGQLTETVAHSYPSWLADLVKR